MKRLSVIDAAFLEIETHESPMHVANLMVMTIPEIREQESFLLELLDSFCDLAKSSAPFNRKLASPHLLSGWPAWIEDDELDLTFHIRRSAVPSPHGIPELLTLVERLHGTMLDRSRPLWELHIIEGLEHNQVAVYCKMHHACIDGVGGIRLIQSILSESKEGRMPQKTKSAARHEHSPVKQRIGNLFQHIQSQTHVIPELSKTVMEVFKQALHLQESDALLPYMSPKTALNVPISAQRRFFRKSFAFQEIYQLAKALNTTLNDVVLMLCGGALREYLKKYHTLPDKSLTAFVPVSFRNHDAGSDGNKVGVIYCSLGTNTDDPLMRMEDIRKTSSSGKERLRRLSGSATEYFSMFFSLPLLLAQATRMSTLLNPPFNVVVSNVPGPKKPLFLNGATVEWMVPVSALFEYQALNITVMSYHDRMDFCLLACRKALPDLYELSELLEASLVELKQLAGSLV
ncbi:MAG: wax ester/triacylglycerol synthase family O-acyltransferase [SAR324 cluster bacterium]|nr:wax ester/triacylglycerol synthase family O-acyltransferase [SAR324 cluster bacterium]